MIYSSRLRLTTPISALQLEFCKAYLNEHHKSDVLLPFTRAFSELGATSVQKNMWMGGSFSIVDAEITDITSEEIHVVATVQERQKSTNESVVISLNSDPVSGMSKAFPTLPQIDPLKLNHASKIPIDNFCRRMIRLCNIVKAYGATGKMVQMGVQLGGKGVGKLVGILWVVHFVQSSLVECLTFNSHRWIIWLLCAFCAGLIRLPSEA